MKSFKDKSMGTKKAIRSETEKSGQDLKDRTLSMAEWGDALHNFEQAAKPVELKNFAKNLVEDNPQIFSGLFSDHAQEVAEQKQKRASLSKSEIKIVVQKSIFAHYDHPKIIEAVADYLYNHFLMI